MNKGVTDKLKLARRTAGVILILCFARTAWATGSRIPPIANLPPAVARLAPNLAREREKLVREREALHSRVIAHNATCGAVQQGTEQDSACLAELHALQADLGGHISDTSNFNQAVAAAESAVSVMDGVNDLARRLKWPPAKRSALKRVMDQLDTGNFGFLDRGQALSIWQQIAARDNDPGLNEAASGVKGADLFRAAAGKQSFQDCVVFALANAAGLPYSVVAARATGLLRRASWRSAQERANPEETLEKIGLNGGEMLMLGEGLGEVRVVQPASFASVLKSGHPIMVGVWPGHEIVLDKSFQYRGATWFVAIDSEQSPLQRRFIRQDELHQLLMENGVAWHRDSHVTPALLR